MSERQKKMMLRINEMMGNLLTMRLDLRQMSHQFPNDDDGEILAELIRAQNAIDDSSRHLNLILSLALDDL